jgi:hypothetical protein
MNDGKAVASLVLGIVSLVFCFIPFAGLIVLITSVLGLVIGISAKSSATIQTGNGLAIAGIVTSCVALGLWVISLFACGLYALI